MIPFNSKVQARKKKSVSNIEILWNELKPCIFVFVRY